MHVSPVPMKTRSGSVSATATAPTDAEVIWKSVTGCQLSPPSVVFHRAAAGCAEVGFVGAALDAGDRDGSAAAIGAEVAPGVAGEEGGVEGGLLGVEITHGRGEEDRRKRDRRDWRAFHSGASCAWGW